MDQFRRCYRRSRGSALYPFRPTIFHIKFTIATIPLRRPNLGNFLRSDRGIRMTQPARHPPALKRLVPSWTFTFTFMYGTQSDQWNTSSCCADPSLACGSRTPKYRTSTRTSVTILGASFVSPKKKYDVLIHQVITRKAVSSR